MVNQMKTFLLLFLLTLLFIFIGNAIAGREGMVYAFILACGMNLLTYWFSDKIVLSMYGAKEIKREDDPQLYSLVEELSQKANLPQTPRLYRISLPVPNAFATGRSPRHAAVAVTDELLRILSPEELAGVISHELAHIKNRDTLIAVIAAMIAGAIMMLARMAQYAMIFGGVGGRDSNREDRGGNALALLLTVVLAPLAAIILQMAISRTREYHADYTGAMFSGKPLALANALRKLHTYSISRRGVVENINPATSHLFIVNPLKGRDILTLFSTHPPIEERIRRLEQLQLSLEKSPSVYNVPKVIY
jgi:heat shock protein HtpX